MQTLKEYYIFQFSTATKDFLSNDIPSIILEKEMHTYLSVVVESVLQGDLVGSLGSAGHVDGELIRIDRRSLPRLRLGSHACQQRAHYHQQRHPEDHLVDGEWRRVLTTDPNTVFSGTYDRAAISRATFFFGKGNHAIILLHKSSEKSRTTLWCAKLISMFDDEIRESYIGTVSTSRETAVLENVWGLTNNVEWSRVARWRRWR